MSTSSKFDIPSLPSWPPPHPHPSPPMSPPPFGGSLITACNDSRLTTIFSQWHRPHGRRFPSMSTFHHPPWCEDLHTRWNECFLEGAQRLERSGSRRPGVKSPPPVLVLCHAHKTFSYKHSTLGWKGRCWQRLSVPCELRQMLLCSLFLLLYHTLPHYIAMFS